MTIKSIPSAQVLFFSTQTTLKELGQYIVTVAKDLYADAARQELLPTGPLQWVYTGADGKPDTQFTLDIILPFAGNAKKPGAFAVKELPAFVCMATMHQGAWDHLFETYDRLIDAVQSKGRQMTGVCREQYLYMDFTNPASNITEVQVGIVA